MSSKFKTVSGIYDPGGRIVEYNSTDFYVRTNGVDVKVTTKKFGQKVARLANLSVGKVVSWVVTKYLTFQLMNGNERRNEKVIEIEDSKFVYDLWLIEDRVTKND